MERLIRRLLLVWLLVAGGILLAVHYGYTQLVSYLVWALAINSLMVMGLLVAQAVLELRDAWRRVQVLRRARHWRRPARPWNPEEWSGYPGQDQGERR